MREEEATAKSSGVTLKKLKRESTVVTSTHEATAKGDTGGAKYGSTKAGKSHKRSKTDFNPAWVSHMQDLKDAENQESFDQKSEGDSKPE